MELGLTLGAPTNKITDLALALGIDSRDTHHQQEPSRSDGDRTISFDPPILRLDLLPLPSSQETATTGSSEGGSSGAATRVFTVIRLPEAVAGEEVSSPNSVDRTTPSRGASDEDETGHTRKKLRLSKEQSAFLEESFKEHHTLNPKQKQALAKQLNLRPRQVEVWFQNRRARTKLKQTEVDCEYLKRCCETLSEENRRLHKELQDLRALKSSNPYHMQLPATTLIMCPSCERTTTAKSSATTATTTNTVASTTTTDSSSKPTPFPISTPKFFPFLSHNNQPQKSMAS